MSPSHYAWDFRAFFKYLPFLLQGMEVTVIVSILAMGVGMLVGLAVALVRLSPIAPLRWLAAFYVDFLRSTPLLVQLVWVFFALPILLGYSLPPIIAGVATLGAYSGAYLAEIFRAGILSIAAGQRHAALALGMTRTQVMRRIVLPQALTRMLPPIASTLITLVKDSSLVSVISVAELMWAAQSLASVSLRPVEVLTGTGLLYVALTYPLSLVAELTRRRHLAV
ncbi:MAG: amino acid ABC transporter permease [Alphaproteobacteria bacterium]|nr:amino acid ABC transporter permease [Alphaproteobacteria bacterium]